MHCPRCGQQQVSSEMRFCSRCGFPMGGVAQLLAQGGLLDSNDEPQDEGMSPRRRGVRQGVLMMLIGAVIVPVLAILDSFTHTRNLLELLVPISAVICFAGGLMRILYALIFEQGAGGGKQAAPRYVPPPSSARTGTATRDDAVLLPPMQSIPVSDFASRRANTAELVPPSVTENTTRLLDEEAPARNE